MDDRELQRLRRRWSAHGDPGAGGRYLCGLARVGKLSARRLELAAYAGHPAACAALGRSDLGTVPEAAPPWVDGLQRWGVRPSLRASLISADLALELLRGETPVDAAAATCYVAARSCLERRTKGRRYAALTAARALYDSDPELFDRDDPQANAALAVFFTGFAAETGLLRAPKPRTYALLARRAACSAQLASWSVGAARTGGTIRDRIGSWALGLDDPSATPGGSEPEAERGPIPRASYFQLVWIRGFANGFARGLARTAWGGADLPGRANLGLEE